MKKSPQPKKKKDPKKTPKTEKGFNTWQGVFKEKASTIRSSTQCSVTSPVPQRGEVLCR